MLRLLPEGSRPPAYLRGAGKVAEIRGHQQHDVFMDLDESRVVFYLSFAHTRWETHLSAPAVCRAARLARSTRARPPTGWGAFRFRADVGVVGSGGG